MPLDPQEVDHCREEQGDYYALDLGGTNLRVLYVKLGAQKGSTVSMLDGDASRC